MLLPFLVLFLPAHVDSQIGAYNTQAAAYLQKLRETGDFDSVRRAQKLIEQALALEPGNYEALRLSNEVDLQWHRFAKVAENSRKLAATKPDDPRNWGTLGDAEMELGQYNAAADAYQRMVNARPGLASFNRVAWYRWVTGDRAGAIQMMERAVGSRSAVPENVAWCLVELGQMRFKSGQWSEAAAAYENALVFFPGYHRALAGMGQTLRAQGRVPEAIAAYKQAQAVIPLPEYAAALEDLYQRGGQKQEAAKQAALIEMIAKMAEANGEKTNRTLALIWSDRGVHLDRALAMLQEEIKERPDVYTYDALAWALYKNGRYEEAAQASAQALQWNTPEPMFWYHASRIAAAREDGAAERKYLQHARELNPACDGCRN